MAKAQAPDPVLRFAAIFSRHATALDWACKTATECWGPIALQSIDFDFDMTNYYDATMGSHLKKRLVAFEGLMDPGELAATKQITNRWEAEYADRFEHPETRPLNIDPGYLTQAKVILATMKDRDHRIYIGAGVFAEVTLYFQFPERWADSRWTYPDYQSSGYHDFFLKCREQLRHRLRQIHRTK